MALEASVEAVARVGEFAFRLKEAVGGTPELRVLADVADTQFRECLNDDLSGPEAMAALFTFIQGANAELDRRGSDSGALDRARQVFASIDSVLDLQPIVFRFVVGEGRVEPDPSTAADLSEGERESISWATSRLAERRLARQRRDFAASDAIRAEVEARGFVVKDTPAGTVLETYH